MTDINTFFAIAYHRLDAYAISLLQQTEANVRAIVLGEQDYCFGIQGYRTGKYFIFYVENSHNKVSGMGLDVHLKIDVATRTRYTIEFSKLINYNYKNIHFIDAFNTFQTISRIHFEALDYVSLPLKIDSLFLYKVVNTKMYKNKICLFPELDKLGLYRWIFDENEKYPILSPSTTSQIYLVLDTTNNLISIDSTNYANGKEVNATALITHWEAPETELLRLQLFFKERKITASWFDLNFEDLKCIKGKLEKYKVA